MEYLHSFLILNGTAISSKTIYPIGNTIVYEVIRLQSGIPLFLEKHLQRLENSTKILNKRLPFSNSDFKEWIKNLVNLNQISSGNIKITVEFNAENEPKQSVIGFIPHNYPSVKDYKNGVKTISTQNLRINPNAKVQNDALRNQLNNLIQTEHAYEAILVHPDGYITEGSRSNIFFIKEDSIITAPNERVLSGISRDNILEICRVNKYEVVLESLKYTELTNIDAAFLTGTSPKVLAIKNIDNIYFNLPNKKIDDISLKYDHLISTYVQNHLS